MENYPYQITKTLVINLLPCEENNFKDLRLELEPPHLNKSKETKSVDFKPPFEINILGEARKNGGKIYKLGELGKDAIWIVYETDVKSHLHYNCNSLFLKKQTGQRINPFTKLPYNFYRVAKNFIEDLKTRYGFSYEYLCYCYFIKERLGNILNFADFKQPESKSIQPESKSIQPESKPVQPESKPVQPESKPVQEPIQSEFKLATDFDTAFRQFKEIYNKECPPEESGGGMGMKYTTPYSGSKSGRAYYNALNLAYREYKLLYDKEYPYDSNWESGSGMGTNYPTPKPWNKCYKAYCTYLDLQHYFNYH